MKSRFAISITALMLAVLFAVPLTAHHTLAVYDSSRASTITGMFTKVEWQNPHVILYMDVKDASGKINSWEIEIGAPGTLVKEGFRREMLELKIPYSVEIWPARHADQKATGRTLTIPDGRKFDVSDKWGMGFPGRGDSGNWGGQK